MSRSMRRALIAPLLTVVQDEAHPTSILLPFMPALPPHRATAPACGSIVGELCITPALG